MTFRLAGTTHFLTIDVADWTTDPDVARVVARRRFDPLDTRPSETVNALLDELAKTGSRATFFLTESVARRDAPLVRRIVHAGHEVAARGGCDTEEPADFQRSAGRVKSTLEDAAGVHVRGFRSGAARRTTLPVWRFEALVEQGFEYDSSRLPRSARGPLDRGVPSYPQTIVCGAGTLLEVPLLAEPFARRPLSLRRSPYAAVQRVFALRTRAGLPAVASFATWEVDSDQPRLGLPLLASWRHYAGRQAARERVDRLLREFRFDAIGHRLNELVEQAPPALTL
jgi:peptidoglycan/xylan/chitin deacetylase (PgdA/CDA1 family)